MSNPQHIAEQITAIVVTYNSAVVIGDCLKALSESAIPTIVVDNASTDNIVEIAQAHKAFMIQQHNNIGFGKAMNIGVAQATTPFCLLINPDATINQDTLPNLLKAAEQHPNAVIIAPEIREPDGRVFEHHSILASLNHPPRRRGGEGDNAVVSRGGNYHKHLRLRGYKKQGSTCEPTSRHNDRKKYAPPYTPPACGGGKNAVCLRCLHTSSAELV